MNSIAVAILGLFALIAALVVAAVVIVAVVWGVTHPPAARLTPHEAYVQSISPFDPHHSGTRQP